MATTPFLMDMENVRHKWGWLLALGIIMIVLGTIAFFIMPAATLDTVIALGWLLVVSGIVEAIHAFRVQRWSGFSLHLVSGVIGIFIGLLIVTHPLVGALGWTLLLSAFFTVIGLFRMVAAITLKFPNWGWAVFDGIVTLLLGIMLWVQWPSSGLWFLGLAVGGCHLGSARLVLRDARARRPQPASAG